LEHILDTWHHFLESTKVDVGTLVQQIKHTFAMLLHFVLHIQLSIVGIDLLVVQSNVILEFYWIPFHVFQKFVMIKKSICVCNPYKEPSEAIELKTSVFYEHSLQMNSIWSNANFSGNYDVCSGWILVRQINLLLKGSTIWISSPGMESHKKLLQIPFFAESSFSVLGFKYIAL